MLLSIYHALTNAGEPFLEWLLKSRLKNNKESAARLNERRGKTELKRPEGMLIWLHAASVGEAQSALTLINKLLYIDKTLQILVTTGTVTSANMIEKKLPERAFHQFYPLDHPEWVSRFLDHWHPDAALWLESEIWPNMLSEIAKKEIPVALVNARLSKNSFRKWKIIKGTAQKLLSVFSVILTQNEEHAAAFRALGAKNVISTGNLKFSAQPLAFNEEDLKTLTAKIFGRPVWLYASSHKGEEALACRVHETLKNTLPDILTIIVPRHPDRREDIQRTCENYHLNTVVRGTDKNPPEQDTDIYIADTIGELGLFYRLAPIACIGRSFSDDGGGGHNPIEAAQLNCVILHGPNVQYQKQIYEDMNMEGAAVKIPNENHLTDVLRSYLTDENKLIDQQNSARTYAQRQSQVIENVLNGLMPLLKDIGFRTIEEEYETA